MDNLGQFEHAVRNFIDSLNDAAANSPYELGYDCGLNGPSNTNCHFAVFATEASTAEWARGKAAGTLAKEQTVNAD